VKPTLIILFIFIFGLCNTAPGWTFHEKSAESRIEELSQRMDSLEKSKDKDSQLDKWLEYITISGLLEVEAGYENYNSKTPGIPVEESSDIILSTVGALDDFNAEEFDFSDQTIKPFAWTLELSFVSSSGMWADMGFAVQDEGSGDCGDFLSETSNGGIFFCQPFKNTSLGLEYLYQEFEDKSTLQVVTAQLAYVF